MKIESLVAYWPNSLYKIHTFKILPHISELHVKGLYFHAIISPLPLTCDCVYVLLYVQV
jgi:hypothetical protein